MKRFIKSLIVFSCLYGCVVLQSSESGRKYYCQGFGYNGHPGTAVGRRVYE